MEKELVIVNYATADGGRRWSTFAVTEILKVGSDRFVVVDGVRVQLNMHNHCQLTAANDD